MYYPPNNQSYYQAPYQQPYQPYQPYQPSYYNPFNPEKRELRKTSCGLGWALLLVLASMIGLELLGVLFLRVIGYHAVFITGFSGFTPVLYYLDIGMAYVLALAVPFTIYLAIKHIRFAEILPFKHVSVSVVIPCVFFGVAACLLSNIPAGIVSSILTSFGFSGALPSSPKTDDLYANILAVVCTMIIPPLVEEFVFRGVVLNRLRKFGDGFAIFASAFLFGMYHGNFIQMPFAFLAGLVFALIVVCTGNLWVTVTIHAINNGLSLLFDFLGRYQGKEFESTVSAWMFLAFIVLGLLSLIFLFVKNKKFFNVEKPATFMRFSTKMGAMFGNPGIIAFVLFCLYTAFKGLKVA